MHTAPVFVSNGNQAIMPESALPRCGLIVAWCMHDAKLCACSVVVFPSSTSRLKPQGPNVMYYSPGHPRQYLTSSSLSNHFNYASKATQMANALVEPNPCCACGVLVCTATAGAALMLWQNHLVCCDTSLAAATPASASTTRRHRPFSLSARTSSLLLHCRCCCSGRGTATQQLLMPPPPCQPVLAPPSLLTPFSSARTSSQAHRCQCASSRALAPCLGSSGPLRPLCWPRPAGCWAVPHTCPQAPLCCCA